MLAGLPFLSLVGTGNMDNRSLLGIVAGHMDFTDRVVLSGFFLFPIALFPAIRK